MSLFLASDVAREVLNNSNMFFWIPFQTLFPLHLQIHFGLLEEDLSCGARHLNWSLYNCHGASRRQFADDANKQYLKCFLTFTMAIPCFFFGMCNGVLWHTLDYHINMKWNSGWSMGRYIIPLKSMGSVGFFWFYFVLQNMFYYVKKYFYFK